jgi:hypothetical protein
MLAFAGEDINTNQMVAAIVANLWSSFEAKYVTSLRARLPL